MTSHTAFRLSAVVAFFGVALGAFGTHILKVQLLNFGTTDVWHTATMYHLVHAVAMLAISREYALRKTAWWLFLAGVVIFSGSLYLLCITNIKVLGGITPIGGVALLAGWACLALCKKEA